MDVFFWQDIVYPVLMVLSILVSLTLFATYLLVDRTSAILAYAGYFLVEATTFFILTMVTGDSPVIDIDTFRPWIIRTRFVMVITLSICLVLQIRRVLEKR